MIPRIGVYWAGVYATISGGFFLLSLWSSRWFWTGTVVLALLVAGTWFAAWRVSKATLFTPLQVEAFQLAREIREYLASCGPRPEPLGDWNLDLIDNYRVKFARRLEDLVLPLNAAKVNGFELQHAPQITNADEVRYVARKLDELAININDPEAANARTAR